MSNRLSVFKALLWKECRESLSILAIGAAVSLFLIRLGSFVHILLSDRSPSRVADIHEMYSIAVFLIVFPVFFIILGADRFPPERGSGTLSYLVSLPVSRTMIWLVKLITAVGSAALFAAFTLLINPFLLEWFGHTSEEDVGGLLGLMVAYVFILLGSFIASILFRSSLSAPGTGLVGLLIYGLLLILLDHYVTRNLFNLMASESIQRYFSAYVLIPLLLVVLLACSYFAFVWLDAASTVRKKIRRGLLILAGALLLPLLATFGLNLHSLSLSESNVVRAGQVACVPASNTVLFTIANQYGYSRICSVPASGGSVTMLPGKTSSFPSPSPDGKLILCNPDSFSNENYYWRNTPRRFPWNLALWLAGFAPHRAHAIAYSGFEEIAYGSRIMLLDSQKGMINAVYRLKKGDHPFYADFSMALWSPDGKKCALGSWYPYGMEASPSVHSGVLLVTLGQEASMKEIKTEIQDAQKLAAINWSDDGSELFYEAPFRGTKGVYHFNSNALCAYDCRTGKTRIVSKIENPDITRFAGLQLEAEKEQEIWDLLSSLEPWKILAFYPPERLVYFTASSCLGILDLVSGNERVISEQIPNNILWFGSFYQKPACGRPGPGGILLFVSEERNSFQCELRVFSPRDGSIRTIDRGRLLIPCGISSDKHWALYYQRISYPPEDMNLCAADLESGRVSVIQKDVKPVEQPAWLDNNTVVFVKGENEIWSAVLDGSRLKRLYPPETGKSD
jgi:ABC-type transport system involved in multi-copper enzyme maturation permease subunit